MSEAQFSRALRLASGASGQSERETFARLSRSEVAISADHRCRGADDVALTVVETLVRGPGRISLINVSDRFAGAAISRAQAIRPDVVVARSSEPRATATRVHVGAADVGADVYGMPDGHGARIGAQPVSQGSAPSPLGVLTTAALVNAEIFKKTVNVRPARHVLHQKLAFCPVSLSDSPTPWHGKRWLVDLALIGLGAVGSAAVRVIGDLELQGSAVVVDTQAYAPENIGTYSLGTYTDVGRPKTSLARDRLRSLSVIELVEDAARLSSLIDAQKVPWPRFVLTGLDSVEARHAAQRLWPDFLIDGATGDTVAGMHEVLGAGRPCLQCFLPERVSETSSLVELSEFFGLSIDQLANGDRLLAAEDLSRLSDIQQRRLASHVGKPICGLAQLRGLIEGADEDDDYRPSIPFVSQLAACLIVGRLIARLNDPLADLPNFVQFDVLVGPQLTHKEYRAATPGCRCDTNRTIIDIVRAERAANVSRGNVIG